MGDLTEGRASGQHTGLRDPDRQRSAKQCLGAPPCTCKYVPHRRRWPPPSWRHVGDVESGRRHLSCTHVDRGTSQWIGTWLEQQVASTQANARLAVHTLLKMRGRLAGSGNNGRKQVVRANVLAGAVLVAGWMQSISSRVGASFQVLPQPSRSDCTHSCESA